MNGEKRHTALVTGASRGIGRAIALRLARTHDIIAVARTPETLAALAQEITTAGGKCETIVLDVTDYGAVAEKLAGKAVDVLINNAGTGPMKPMLELSPQEWHRIIDVNVNSLYHVTRSILPGMIERKRGHIINIGSIAGRSAFVGGTAYAASKHALNAFTECLMLEVRDHGVKVSVVAPGSVATEFSARAMSETWRLAPEEVAEAVAAVLDTPADVLIHRVEIRPLTPNVR